MKKLEKLLLCVAGIGLVYTGYKIYTQHKTPKAESSYIEQERYRLSVNISSPEYSENEFDYGKVCG